MKKIQANSKKSINSFKMKKKILSHSAKISYSIFYYHFNVNITKNEFFKNFQYVWFIRLSSIANYRNSNQIKRSTRTVNMKYPQVVSKRKLINRLVSMFRTRLTGFHINSSNRTVRLTWKASRQIQSTRQRMRLRHCVLSVFREM